MIRLGANLSFKLESSKLKSSRFKVEKMSMLNVFSILKSHILPPSFYRTVLHYTGEDYVGFGFPVGD